MKWYFPLYHCNVNSKTSHIRWIINVLHVYSMTVSKQNVRSLTLFFIRLNVSFLCSWRHIFLLHTVVRLVGIPLLLRLLYALIIYKLVDVPSHFALCGSNSWINPCLNQLGGFKFDTSWPIQHNVCGVKTKLWIMNNECTPRELDDCFSAKRSFCDVIFCKA